MISDFNAQYFGGNENCVNAKFKLLLNHSSLIIMAPCFCATPCVNKTEHAVHS